MIDALKNWWYARQRKKELAQAPVSLEAALDLMVENWPTAAKHQFMLEPEDAPGGKYHHFSGMAMRNAWGLWVKEQPLTQWFRAHEIWHADDMSAIIYKALWFRLHEKKFDIDKEAKYYKAYWKKQGIGFDGAELPNYKKNQSLTIRVSRKNKRKNKKPAQSSVHAG
jgi:hypothetical protein